MGFLFISVYTDFQMFGLEMDGGVFGREGYKLSETTLQQGGLWYMVHNTLAESIVKLCWIFLMPVLQQNLLDENFKL